MSCNYAAEISQPENGAKKAPQVQYMRGSITNDICSGGGKRTKSCGGSKWALLFEWPSNISKLLPELTYKLIKN